MNNNVATRDLHQVLPFMVFLQSELRYQNLLERVTCFRVEETGLEPQQQPFTNGISSEVQMSISVLQTLIALVGIVGNSAVIYAYQSKKNRVTSENLIMILGAIDVMCCIYWAVSNTLKG